MLINLLPHRDISLARRRQAFVRHLLLSGLLALVVVAGWCAFLEQSLADQTESSQQLRQEIKLLDARIQRLAVLQADINALALREAVLQQLQDERQQPADWLPQLMHLPEGLYLSAVKLDALGVHVQGAARASTQVFEWVQQLARQTHGLQRPELIDLSVPAPSSTSALPAGVAFSLRAQPRALPASADPKDAQSGGKP